MYDPYQIDFNTTIPPLDPSYGKIVFGMYHWEYTENADDFLAYQWSELRSHNCSSDELGFSGTDHKFWQLGDQMISLGL